MSKKKNKLDRQRRDSFRNRALEYLSTRTLLPTGRGIHSDKKIVEMLMEFGHPNFASVARVLGINPDAIQPLVAPQCPKLPRPQKIKAKKKKQRCPKKEHPSKLHRQQPTISFYESDEWRHVRYFALKAALGLCQCCGSKPSPGKPLHVDHIKPRSKYPELELDKNNLQVLCLDCNLGKSNKDETDWRPVA